MFEISYCIYANTSYTYSLVEPTVTRQMRAMRLSWHHSKHSIKIFKWEAISSNDHSFEISLVIIHHRLFFSTGAEVNFDSFTSQTTMESATIRPESTNIGKLNNWIWFWAVNQVNQITCDYQLCTPREPIILYCNFCTHSGLISRL